MDHLSNTTELYDCPRCHGALLTTAPAEAYSYIQAIVDGRIYYTGETEYVITDTANTDEQGTLVTCHRCGWSTHIERKY